MPSIRACDVCFKRKIQCCKPDAGSPCNWCSHQNIACTFNRERQKNTTKKNKPKDKNKLLCRITQLESALQQANATQFLTAQAWSEIKALRISLVRQEDCRQTSPVEQRDDNKYSQALAPAKQAQKGIESNTHENIVFATRLFGQNWYHKGMPIISETGLEWTMSRTDQSTAALRSYLFSGSSDRLCWSFSALQGDATLAELWRLPDKDLVWKEFSIFSESFPLFFPILDEELFKETIDTAYQSFEGKQTSHKHTSAMACLLAAFAVLSHLKVSGEMSASVDGKTCAARAQWFLELVNGPAKLDNLQAVLLLHKYRTVTGQCDSAEALHTTACRMVCELNGHSGQSTAHTFSESPISQQQRDHIRKLFWLCYMSDKDFSLLSGKPPILANDYCDLSKLEEYPGHDMFLHGASKAGDSNAIAWERLIPFLPGDPYLGILKEKIFRLLYSPPALQLMDSELLTRIRQLDDELDIWRLSIPLAIRPKLSILQNHPGSLPLTRLFSGCLRSVQLQLEYHYLLTLIHTTVRRFGADKDTDCSIPNDLNTVMHSSIDLSLEASRSTLYILSEPIARLKQETFWHTVIYPLIAAISLFVNILIHPLSPQAEIDIESLALASKIFHKMLIRTTSSHEMKHTQQTSELMAELLRLANAAILKADKGMEEG